MHLSFPLSQFCTFVEQLPVQVLFSGSETNKKFGVVQTRLDMLKAKLCYYDQGVYCL